MTLAGPIGSVFHTQALVLHSTLTSRADPTPSLVVTMHRQSFPVVGDAGYVLGPTPAAGFFAAPLVQNQARYPCTARVACFHCALPSWF